MKVVVTGGRGKVGLATVAALQAAGHDVVSVDMQRPVFEADLPGAAPYVQADLTDAGAAFAVVRGCDAVCMRPRSPTRSTTRRTSSSATT